MVGGVDIAKLARVVASRYRELIPGRTYRVETQGTRLSVTRLQPSRHAGSTLIGPAFVIPALPLPRGLLLKTLFEAEAESLQSFVSRIEHREWPAPDAQPHACVNDEQVLVWYGKGDYEAAALAWRPIDLIELDP